MEISPVRLEAIYFDSIPTGAQVADALNEIHKFLSRTGGVLTADGSHTAANQEIAQMLNASNLLKQAADLFGRSSSGLVLPMAGPGLVRQ